MFSNFFGVVAGNHITELYVYKFALQHPYLFTLIKIADPLSLYGIIGIVAYKLLSGLARKR